jgi:hypothetical protein
MDSSRHNEFIKDTDKFFNDMANDITDINIKNNRLSDYIIYKNKWSTLFRPKTELNINEQIIKDKEKVCKLYAELKNSIVYAKDNIQDVIQINTIDEAINKIKFLLRSEACNKTHIVHHDMGRVLLMIKNESGSKKTFQKLLNKLISVNYAYKLIKFYKTCNEYDSLAYTTLPFKIIINNLTELKKLMYQDKIFWNPPA